MLPLLSVELVRVYRQEIPEFEAAKDYKTDRKSLLSAQENATSTYQNPHYLSRAQSSDVYFGTVTGFSLTFLH
jgi:hypothetical protein